MSGLPSVKPYTPLFPYYSHTFVYGSIVWDNITTSTTVSLRVTYDTPLGVPPSSVKTTRLSPFRKSEPYLEFLMHTKEVRVFRRICCCVFINDSHYDTNTRLLVRPTQTDLESWVIPRSLNTSWCVVHWKKDGCDLTWHFFYKSHRLTRDFTINIILILLGRYRGLSLYAVSRWRSTQSFLTVHVLKDERLCCVSSTSRNPFLESICVDRSFYWWDVLRVRLLYPIRFSCLGYSYTYMWHSRSISVLHQFGLYFKVLKDISNHWLHRWITSYSSPKIRKLKINSFLVGLDTFITTIFMSWISHYRFVNGRLSILKGRNDVVSGRVVCSLV